MVILPNDTVIREYAMENIVDRIVNAYSMYEGFDERKVVRCVKVSKNSSFNGDSLPISMNYFGEEIVSIPLIDIRDCYLSDGKYEVENTFYPYLVQIDGKFYLLNTGEFDKLRELGYSVIEDRSFEKTTGRSHLELGI